MSRILITGGAGFIGANFVHYWLDRYNEDEVIVIDALTYAGNRQSIQHYVDQSRLKFIHGNICDEKLLASLFKETNIDYIVHFAAESHVDRSILTPDIFIETNIIGTHNLLKTASNSWTRPDYKGKGHFHHVSTDEVFGSLEIDDPAFTEATGYDPRSPYSASKASSDHLVRAFHHTYGLNVTISNCSNNYGPYHYPEKLIPLSILKILHGQTIPIYGDGMHIRDWLYVKDHCHAIDLILKHGAFGQTYNIGGNAEKTNKDLVSTLCNLIDTIFTTNENYKKKYPLSPPAKSCKSDDLIEYVNDRPGHDKRYAMNISKISEELGFIPEYEFDKGLTETILWYLENETWWQPLLDSQYEQWISTQYK